MNKLVHKTSFWNSIH